MPDPALSALIYMRDLACHEHLQKRAERERHRVVGFKHDPTGDQWVSVVEACLRGEYDVIVRCSDLDMNRVPRVEIDPHPGTLPPDPPGPGVKPRSRRPRPPDM